MNYTIFILSFSFGRVSSIVIYCSILIGERLWWFLKCWILGRLYFIKLGKQKNIVIIILMLQFLSNYLVTFFRVVRGWMMRNRSRMVCWFWMVWSWSIWWRMIRQYRSGNKNNWTQNLKHDKRNDQLTIINSVLIFWLPYDVKYELIFV